MPAESIRTIAHPYRRAGFGATRADLEAYAARGYEACVDDLLSDTAPAWMGDDIIRRFHDDQSGMMGPFRPAST